MIHIFLRETNHNKPNNERPGWFNYERCFKSLLDTLDSEVSKLTVVFDGKPQNHYVDKYKKTHDYDIVEINAGNDFNSNTKTFEYINSLTNIKPNDLIMVQENDYLFLPWISDVLFLYHHNTNYEIWDNTYISLFDHLDKYIFNTPTLMSKEYSMYSDLKSQIYLGGSRYWRTVPSTCGSFIMSKIVFDKDLDIHTSGDADNTRFGECQKRGRKVLSPMPALATHCNKYFISPYVNWGEFNKNIKLL